MSTIESSITDDEINQPTSNFRSGRSTYSTITDNSFRRPLPSVNPSLSVNSSPPVNPSSDGQLIIQPPITIRRTNQPSNTINPPSNTINPPSNTINPPSNRINPPSNTINPPSNRINPPSNTINPPSNRINPPSNRINLPSNRINPPSNRSSIQPPIIINRETRQPMVNNSRQPMVNNARQPMINNSRRGSVIIRQSGAGSSSAASSSAASSSAAYNFSSIDELSNFVPPGRRRGNLSLEDDLDGKELLIGEDVEQVIDPRDKTVGYYYDEIHNLSDLVYSYPFIRDPSDPMSINSSFQNELSSKLEFKALRSDGKEPLPERGSFFRHQVFIHRFLQIYKQVLLIHPTGSGKTCSGGGSTEWFRRSFLRGVIDYVTQYLSGSRNQIRHVYIMVPGPVVRMEFYNQIICKCSRPGDYDISTSDTKSGMRKVRESLNAFYTIGTYGDFFKSVKNLTDQEIKDKYSGYMFLIDEGHKISMNLDDYNKIYKMNRGQTIKNSTKIEQYRSIARTFDLVDRATKVIMTATPMINTPIEFNSLMNLLLPIDMKLNPTDDLTDWTEDELQPYITGRVSYVPEVDIKADITEMGESLNNFITDVNSQSSITTLNRNIVYRTIVYPGYMLKNEGVDHPPYINLPPYNPNRPINNTNIPFQSDIYERLPQRKRHFHGSARQASNFVYPNGSIGAEGFKAYMTDQGLRSLQPWLHYDSNPRYNMLATRSIKYSQIMELILAHREQPGKYYCYFTNVEGSGLEILAEVLRANGYQEYDGLINAYVQYDEQTSNYCQEEDTMSEIKRDFRPSPRFAIFTGKTTNVARSRILKLFNSRENMNGEYIEVILMSPTAQLGLSLYDTTAVSIVGAYWNEAITYQSITRAIRVVGFKNLLQHLRQEVIFNNYQVRQEALNRGEDPEAISYEDPNEVRVDVKIYRHVAIAANGESSDLEIYRAAEEKSIRIETLMRKIKTLSIDCMTHQLRQREVPSVRVRHLPFDYPCYDSYSLPIDPNAYNVMYAEPNVERATTFIKELFKMASSYRIEHIFDEYLRLGKEILETNDRINLDLLGYLYSPKFVVRAVRNLIEHRAELTDRFGLTHYLHNDRDLLFLSDGYPSLTNSFTPLSSYYIDMLTGIPIRDLASYVRLMERPQQENTIERIKNLRDVFLIYDEINKLNNDGKAALVEWMLLHRDHPNYTTIREKFNFRIHEGKYPTRLIQKVRDRLVHRGPGRPPEDETKVEITFTSKELADKKNYDKGTKIILHNLYGAASSSTHYQDNANFNRVRGRIRLLIKKEGYWKDPDINEASVYRQVMEYKLSKDLKTMGLIYGRIDNETEFRIINYLGKNVNQKDKRRQPKGIVCSTIRKTTIYEILVHVGYEQPLNIASIEVPDNEQDIRAYLLRQGMEEPAIDRFAQVTDINDTGEEVVIGQDQDLKLQRMKEAYRWAKHGEKSGTEFSRKNICEDLKSYLLDNNKVVIN